MTRLVPVRDIAHQRLMQPADDRWTENVSWIPVSATEIHLACRYFPLAIRTETRNHRRTHRLGLIVDQRYTAHPLLDTAGIWRGAYRPVALRCFPFQAPTLGNDPLSDLMIDPDCGYLSATAGTPLVDNAGRAGRLLSEIHRLFCLLKQGEDTFAAALDHYLIADLLVPLPGTDEVDDEANLYVLDPARLSHLEHGALGAMARHRFMSVDIAIACRFSLQNLRPQYRPKDQGQPRHLRAASLAPDIIAIDDLSLAIDDSELIALWDIDALRSGAHP